MNGWAARLAGGPDAFYTAAMKKSAPMNRRASKLLPRDGGTLRFYRAGQWASGRKTMRVTCPYDDRHVATVGVGTAADVSEAIGAAADAFEQTRQLPSYVREQVCRQIADGIEEHAELFAETMCCELGKPLAESRIEVSRAMDVFRVSGEEAKRVGGEIIDLDWRPGAEKRLGLVRRFPRGVIGAITPFNFPLNLVAHKLGPAIASGNSIVLKPASKTPLSALLLAALIDQTAYPKGAVSIIPASSADTKPLLEDQRVKMITFTGSAEVGWWIKNNSGAKPVILELGGNAGVIIADDADLEFAATRLLPGIFGVAGQSCISVQRVFVQDSVMKRLTTLLVGKARGLKVGDPFDEKTQVGPMVDRAAVANTLSLVRQAVRTGARVLIGGTAAGNLMAPTLLTKVDTSLPICTRELFAPVGLLIPYRTIDQAIAMVNDSIYGLQAGIFTNRLADVLKAYERIECGGVIVNDIPTWRVDHMPYGGMKRSGLGREGIRYAIEDMTEPKLLALNGR